MAARRRMKLTSNFKAAANAGEDAMRELIEEATDAMHEKAQERMGQQAGRRDYNLNPSDIQKHEGRITYEPFYGRWFEYGTVHIQALPFMRPGHRAGRKHLTTEGVARGIFEKWIGRKARVRR